MDAGDPLADALAAFDRTDSPYAPLTTSEVADALDCTRRTAYNRLDRLAERGDLETKKVGARGRVWWRPPDGSDDELESERNGLERELDEMFERIDDAFYALDEEWRYSYMNERAEEILGQFSDGLLGERIWDALPSAAVEVIREPFEQAMAAQERTDFEVFSEALSAWLKFHIYPSESGLSVYFRNVTERKHRERRLERYETIIETIWDGVYALDDDERFVMVNEALLELTGYDRDELLGEPGSVVHDEEVNERAGALADEVVAGRRSGATLEFDLRTADGDAILVESRFGPYRYGENAYARTGVVRDVTKRKQFEETLTSLNDSAGRLLGAETRDEVSQVVVDTATDVLDLSGVVVYRNDPERDVLYPAERSVEAGFMRREFPEVPRGDGSITGRVFAEGRTQYSDDITVDSDLDVDPEDTNMRAGLFVPMADHGILVVGSPEAGSFDDDTRQLVEILTANAEAAYDRVGREERLAHQRGQLEALDDLNGVVREINEALVRQSTREEVEQVVCDRLADSDSYRFAWVGEADSKHQRVTLRAEAGVEGYLDDADISTDPDEPTGQGPTGRAIRTHEIQVSRNVGSDSDYETWRDHAARHDYRSSAAIPIVHEGTLYGVLNVYAARPDAFEDEERAVIGQLGEVVGHAIASIERKRMLMSDEVVELEFQIRDVLDVVGVSPSDGSIRFDRTVPLGDGEYLKYGTVTDDARETLTALAAEIDYWESVSIIAEEFGTARFELRLSKPPVVSTVSAHGGHVSEATIEDGDYRMAVHLPDTADVRNVTDEIRDAYPTAEVVARRQVAAGDATERVARALADDLTDRQRATLEAAYFAGFFEWPRETDGKAVADSLDITDSTFHQHVRKAEGKLLDALFAEATETIG